jgi:NarL family two-component system sensor histidine kinase YdfH
MISRRPSRRWCNGLPCTVALDGIEDIPAALYETVQRFNTEGLSNVARHAQATQVTIRGRHEAGGYLLAIHDNGAGFDPAAALTQTGHYGLVGLRERARFVGGHLEIESVLQQGTTLRCFLPLETHARDPLVLERSQHP